MVFYVKELYFWDCYTFKNVFDTCLKPMQTFLNIFFPGVKYPLFFITHENANNFYTVGGKHIFYTIMDLKQLFMKLSDVILWTDCTTAIIITAP